MRTITIEEHFLSTGFAALGQGGPAGALQEKLKDLGDGRLRDMDAAGIDMQVLSHTAGEGAVMEGERGVKLARGTNDELAAAVKAHPDRFAGLAFLPMASPDAAVEELERAIQELGFKGAIINGTTNGRFLDDERFTPILEKAVALDVPIYLHPAPPPSVVKQAYYDGFDENVSMMLSMAGWGWHSEIGIHSLRMILAGVFDRLPGLRIIIGHMGEMIPFMLDRSNNVLTQFARNLQHPVAEYFLRNFYVTTSGFFSDPPLLMTMQVIGADRIIFSVDYPYSTNEQGRTFLDRVAISPADKEKISHGNAERVLKLSR
jgi:predicted TIM-barrel fold metal-dependent hydrolase